MINRLDSEFGFLRSALNLRAERQQLLASNIANADTPNYKAMDIDFATALKRAEGAQGGRAAMVTTDSRHLQPANGGNSVGGAPAMYRIPAQSSLDNNTVDMDVERAQFTDNAIHYQFLLDRISMKVKSLASAIQGQ